MASVPSFKHHLNMVWCRIICNSLWYNIYASLKGDRTWKRNVTNRVNTSVTLFDIWVILWHSVSISYVKFSLYMHIYFWVNLFSSISMIILINVIQSKPDLWNIFITCVLTNIMFRFHNLLWVIITASSNVHHELATALIGWPCATYLMPWVFVWILQNSSSVMYGI